MNTLTIELGSRLSFKQTNEFVDKVGHLLAGNPSCIYVDMQSCVYLNSIALSGLIRAHKLCEQKKTPFILTNVQASAYTLFETTNVLELFAIENTPLSQEEDKLEIEFELLKPHLGFFKISGNFNGAHQSQQFRIEYEKELPELKSVLIGLQFAENIGSVAINELFRLRGMLYEKSGMLVLESTSESIESVWRMMHLNSLIPLCKSRDQALQIIQQHQPG